MNWGDCVIRSGTSFDRANYTGRLVEGTPTEMQLFQVSEVSAALPPYLGTPISVQNKGCSRSVSCIWAHNVHQMFF